MTRKDEKLSKMLHAPVPQTKLNPNTKKRNRSSRDQVNGRFAADFFPRSFSPGARLEGTRRRETNESDDED